ncbi:hypothetical protein ABZ777_12885 [Micromonospora parva]|uniref:hypothetical protein n=1 Tax=Micromonospora parva TaxID=1464048 RepID=UPI0033C0C6A3
MTTLIFVHGTGGRTHRYEPVLKRFDAAMRDRCPDTTVIPCLWGDRLGSPPPAPRRSIPRYRPSTTAQSPVSGWPTARWTILDLDPLHDVRVCAAVSARTRPAPRLPGQPSNADRISRAVAQMSQAATLKEDLVATGLAEGFDMAVDSVLRSAPAREAIAQSQGDAAWGELVDALAEAIIAETLRHQSSTTRLVPADRRRLVESVIDAFQGGQLGVLGTAARISAELAMRMGGAWALDHWRGPLSDSAHPFVGDILRYLARGEAIRRLIADCVRDAAGPVVLVGHSLGGIAALDTLVLRSLPAVAALVTVGSQGPLLHEMGALPSLDAGEDLPGSVPRWLNVHHRRDLLSYLAEPIFPGRVEDVEIAGNEVMPEAHSSYFDRKAFYDLLASLVEEVGRAAP